MLGTDLTGLCREGHEAGQVMCSEWRLARRECYCLLGFITKTPPVVSIFLHRVPSNTLTPFHLCPTQYKFARAQRRARPQIARCTRLPWHGTSQGELRKRHGLKMTKGKAGRGLGVGLDAAGRDGTLQGKSEMHRALCR